MSEYFADKLEELLGQIVRGGYRLDLLQHHVLTDEGGKDLGISEIWYGDLLIARATQIDPTMVRVEKFVSLEPKQNSEN